MITDPVDISYASAACADGPVDLMATLWRAGAEERPSDLLVWLHSGGFRTGSRNHPSHDAFARIFNRFGISFAAIDYRRRRARPVLAKSTQDLLPDLIHEAREAGEEMPPRFFGAEAMAPLEDCVSFLQYASANPESSGLGKGGRIFLGGSSVGGITALNTLYLPRHLGLERPDIAAVVALSGGFAYTPRLSRTDARILALHGDLDNRVPISSIRRLHRTTPDPMQLLTHPDIGHGSPTLNADERPRDGVRRLAQFLTD
ncbi:MAG: hypothetical protein Q4G25_01220 [Paracoccus sp. (in: a-proteobacteria)]|nr:hypothetical protein [Paracoccus sp. (in: a-proteobacteria)]